MAKKSNSDEAPAVTGTSRIFKSGKVSIPAPHIEPKQIDPVVEKKKPDPPAKPHDVHVTAAHLVQTLKRNAADNRSTRLVELARHNQDVKWLLAEYERLTADPKKN